MCCGKDSFCNDSRDFGENEQFWHCECKDHHSKISLCWECAYFGRGQQLGGYETQGELAEGMVQISDLKNGNFVFQLLTTNEVLKMHKVKNISLHDEVLTWLVVCPD
jgi:hypothetical protein